MEETGGPRASCPTAAPPPDTPSSDRGYLSHVPDTGRRRPGLRFRRNEWRVASAGTLAAGAKRARQTAEPDPPDRRSRKLLSGVRGRRRERRATGRGPRSPPATA